MIQVTTAIDTIIAETSCESVEIYGLNISDDLDIYLTNHSEDITFDSKTYTAIGISRTPIRKYLKTGTDDVTITIDNIEATSPYKKFSNYKEIDGEEFGGKVIIIKKVFIGLLGTSTNYVTRFDGIIDNISYNDSQFEIKAKIWTSNLENKIPKRTYKPICHWVFAGTECTLTRISFSNIVTGRGRHNLRDAIYCYNMNETDYPQDVFKDGYFEFTSGNNNGSIKKVKSNYDAFDDEQEEDAHKIEFYESFTKNIIPGDSFTVTSGCDKTQQNCINHNNTKNFSGFLGGTKQWFVRQIRK